MAGRRPHEWLPRGRLVRRLILLLFIATVLPVVVASAVAYLELVKTVDRQQARVLRDEAKNAGMNVLGQFQLVSATLDLPAPPDLGAREIPGGLGTIRFERMPDTGRLAAAAPGLEPRVLEPLRAGLPVLSWHADDSANAALRILKYQPATGVLASARIDPRQLVRTVAGEGAALALTMGSDGALVYDSQQLLTRTRAAEWRTAAWVLPLSGLFHAPSLKITVGATRQSVLAQIGLFKVVVPLVLAAALSISGWFAIALLRRQLAPLQTIAGATRRIVRREFDVRLDIATDDEFSDLARDFNSMAEHLDRQISTLESVSEVDRLLLSAPSLENILEALLPRMARVLGAERMGVLLPDSESGTHARFHEFRKNDPGLGAIQRVPLPFEWEVACSTMDNASKARFVSGLLDSASASVIFQPLTQGTRVIGCLCAAWPHGTELPFGHEQTARDLADRLSVALANLSHEQELLRRARFDGLTGLANRQYFAEALEARLADGTGTAGNAALLYIDLDGFKNINDSAGHEAGDQVLLEIAERLRQCVGPGDVVSRLGGDEFAILVDAGDDARRPGKVATEALLSLQRHVTVSGLDRPMSASIGLARIPEDGDSSEVLLRNADIAMYKAKELGRDRVAVFNPAMLSQVQARVDIEIGLRNAIEAGELALHYQPIVGNSGVLGAEALLRWNWRGHREIGPAQFIPIAEQSGLINRLGMWSMNQACADLAAWRRDGVVLDYVSVNVAPRQLQSEHLVEELMQIVAGHSLKPRDLQLEITESAIADGERARGVIQDLAALGFRIAMDDFGTGYSSLSHLHKYPFEVVKVDRSFIAGLPGDAMSVRLVDAIIRMAHGLGKRVVAEGVESMEQSALLQGLGCDAMQGYLYGQPQDAGRFRREQLEDLAARPGAAARGDARLSA